MSSSSFIYFVNLCFCSILFCSGKNRHIVYWDPAVMPGLTMKDFSMEVKIGQFMDILCPQKSLVHLTNTHRNLQAFDLYNVTADQYEACETGDSKNLIFSCNRPEKENKLTIKFQLISPSPLGFRFKYCHHYYFVAKSRDSGSGCHRDTTRLRIFVACQDRTSVEIEKKNITKITSSKQEEQKHLLKRIMNKKLDQLDQEPTDHENILVSDLVPIHKVRRRPRVLASSSEREEQHGHNSSSSFLRSSCGVKLITSLLLSIFLLL